MKKHDTFYVVSALTTLITRVLVYMRPVASPTINGFRLHHYMYGLAGILLCLLLAPFKKSIIALAISMGIFIDESGYLLIDGKTHEDNYSPESFMLIMLVEIILFLLRKPIIKYYIGED